MDADQRRWKNFMDRFNSGLTIYACGQCRRVEDDPRGPFYWCRCSDDHGSGPARQRDILAIVEGYRKQESA